MWVFRTILRHHIYTYTNHRGCIIFEGGKKGQSSHRPKNSSRWCNLEKFWGLFPQKANSSIGFPTASLFNLSWGSKSIFRINEGVNVKASTPVLVTQHMLNKCLPKKWAMPPNKCPKESQTGWIPWLLHNQVGLHSFLPYSFRRVQEFRALSPPSPLILLHCLIEVAPSIFLYLSHIFYHLLSTSFSSQAISMVKSLTYMKESHWALTARLITTRSSPFL